MTHSDVRVRITAVRKVYSITSSAVASSEFGAAIQMPLRS